MYQEFAKPTGNNLTHNSTYLRNVAWRLHVNVGDDAVDRMVAALELQSLKDLYTD